MIFSSITYLVRSSTALGSATLRYIMVSYYARFSTYPTFYKKCINKKKHFFQSISTLIIAYMFYCAYSTVLKIRLLNLYYLAPHHQTNEYSLIFSGMMVCRLTPAMCLNFLSLVHMDSHIIKERIMETYYTQVNKKTLFLIILFKFGISRYFYVFIYNAKYFISLYL